MKGQRKPARPGHPLLLSLVTVALLLASPPWCEGSAAVRDRAPRREDDPSLETVRPPESPSPGARTLQEFRTTLQEYSSIFDLDGMGEGLENIAQSRSHLLGRAGYELLAFDGALAGEAAPSPDAEGKGMRAMLGRVRMMLGDSDAGKLLAQALDLRRGPFSSDGSSPAESRRSEADVRLTSLLLRGERSWPADRLAETRRLFEALGDQEGLGSFYAGAAPGAPTAEETCTLNDAAAEAFERANDRWSAASARESCVLAGGPERDDPRDLERLESAAQGYTAAADFASEARVRLTFGQRLLDARRGRQALDELRIAEKLLDSHMGSEEAKKLCARGIADAVLQIVELASASSDAASLDGLLTEGEAAAKRGGSPPHEAWIAFERARLWALPAGPTAEAEAEAHRGLAIFRASANDEGIVECASLLGDWAASLGRHAEAATSYREAALSSAALGESDAQLSLSVLRAEELRRGGRFDAAGHLARTLLEGGGLSPRRRQNALSILGDALLVSGRAAEAETAYAQAQQLADAPGIPARRAAALIRSGRPKEAAAVLEPVVAAAGVTRLDERLFVEAMRLAGDSIALPPASGADVDAGAVDRGRLAGRLLTSGRRAESLQAAKDLAETDDPASLFDAASVAAGAGERLLAQRWAERAVARGLDRILLAIDPDLGPLSLGDPKGDLAAAGSPDDLP